jgi:hypothetical protein
LLPSRGFQEMNPAFNGDSFIEVELTRLVKKWSIRTIVETGTYQGDSTRALATFGPAVITIEIDRQRFESATDLDQIPNVRRLHGDSAEVLHLILPYLAGPILYYLDAHWNAHSPLLDELEAIARGPACPVIAIHDFFNPMHPEYSFDTWDIGEYRLELVTTGLNHIYGAKKWHHWFNDQSDAQPPRGILYVEPICESSHSRNE